MALPQHPGTKVPSHGTNRWGQPVYAPCVGTVLLAEDGYPENRRTGFFSDLRRAYQSAHSFDPAHDTIQAVAGNFVIIRYAEDVCAALRPCKPAQSGFPPGSLSARGKSLERSAIPAIPFPRTSTSS